MATAAVVGLEQSATEWVVRLLRLRRLRRHPLLLPLP